jgi:hypothetical protein
VRGLCLRLVLFLGSANFTRALQSLFQWSPLPLLFWAQSVSQSDRQRQTDVRGTAINHPSHPRLTNTPQRRIMSAGRTDFRKQRVDFRVDEETFARLNYIALLFEEKGTARQVLKVIRQLRDAGHLELTEAVAIHRNSRGYLKSKSAAQTSSKHILAGAWEGTKTGTIVGMHPSVSE